MTLSERADAFNLAYSKWPASHLRVVKEQGRGVLYGRWVIGNDYRNKTRYYGAYPAGYLQRVHALFPDIITNSESDKHHVLHAFSGSLEAGNYARCDVRHDMQAEFCCAVEDLPNQWPHTDKHAPHLWRLVFADPPYSSEDAKKYGTRSVNRGKVTSALARVCEPGAFLVWLDTCWPMHRKDEWLTVGRIVVTRSTNHRVRDVTIFQRQDAA